MARSIWGGAISFGLVNVPVKLFTAVRKKDVRFHQLHRPDGARINQKRVCSAEGEEVAYEDIVKGYEIAKGQYVVVEPEELDALDPESTHTIDIEDFVELDQIDPLFFDSSYYVVPDDRGEKAYRLLLEAMRDANKVGIARVVMRSKQYLVAIRPVEDALVMSTMNFADEVVPQADLEGLPGTSANVSDRELTMARQLIESLTTDFEPDKYEDTYREKVLELIEQKAEGREVVAQPEAKAATPVVDLMAALEASLASARGDKAKAGPKGTAKGKGTGEGEGDGTGEKAKDKEDKEDKEDEEQRAS